MNKEFLTIDGISVPIEGERNILELARKANIEIPTFCYHSQLSVYGACRLCLVDIKGRGIVTSCSTLPAAGMQVKTNTAEIREMRKIALELILANHEVSCPSCDRAASCKLQDLSRRMGIDKIRFKKTDKDQPKDFSSPSLVRDPNKCVLCGDCVRMCKEVQGIGAIDFINRGKDVRVEPAFCKNLGDVECVNCGQCAAVCPVGAIVANPETEAVWNALSSKRKVVAQIAPAVRVAIGEMFGLEAGTVTTGKIVSALKMLGFDQVYDTSFSADLTVIEEASEFLERYKKGEKLPQFTSCCPAWVKFAEQYYPELLPNLSSCKSPQQMFGALAKEMLPEKMGIPAEDIYIVSIMPCTAKKYEKNRPEFAKDGQKEVDAVLTTQELGRMIEEAGIQFNSLKPESFDLPFGFKTGAGVLFGNSGGVSEAVLRYAAEKATGEKLENVNFEQVRGDENYRISKVKLGDIELKLAIVSGLANAKKLAEKIKEGKTDIDLVEVMACPGGCVGGAGQPVSCNSDIVKKRTQGIFDTDKTMQLHKSQDNPYINEAYKECLGEIGGHKAHELLHTKYQNRKRLSDAGFTLVSGSEKDKIAVKVCVGTNCYLKGSQNILHTLIRDIQEKGLEEFVDVKATFCFENCMQAPNVQIGSELVGGCTLESARKILDEQLAAAGIEPITAV